MPQAPLPTSTRTCPPDPQYVFFTFLTSSPAAAMTRITFPGIGEITVAAAADDLPPAEEALAPAEEGLDTARWYLKI